MRALALYFLSACAAIAADTIPTIVWTVDCQAPSAWNMQLTSGESIDMQPQYLLRQRVLTLTNATSVSFQFRAAGTTNVPYELPGSVLNATNGKARIVWPSSNVVAAGAYEYKIVLTGIDSANMRGFGTVTVNPGFGVVTGRPPPYVALVTPEALSDVRSNAAQAFVLASNAIPRGSEGDPLSVHLTNTTLAVGSSVLAAINSFAQGKAATAANAGFAQGNIVTSAASAMAQGGSVVAGLSSFAQGSFVTNGQYSFSQGTKISIGNKEFAWNPESTLYVGHGPGSVSFYGTNGLFLDGGGRFVGSAAGLSNFPSVVATGDFVRVLPSTWTGGVFATSGNVPTNISINGIIGTVSNGIASLTIPPDLRIQSLLTRINYLEQNNLLMWIQMQINDGMTRAPLADGYRDFFEDLSGINAALSTNMTWSSKGFFSWGAAAFEGMILRYDMDDNSANYTVSDKGGLYDGTASQLTSDMATSGKLNGALYFNGSGSSVSGSGFDLDDYAEFTIAFWLSLDPYASQGSLVYFPEDIGWSGTSLFMFGGRNRIDMRIGSGDPDKANYAPAWEGDALPADTWIHFAMVHGAALDQIYINGVIVFEHESYDTAGSAANFTLMGDQNPQGKMDDFRIYSKALTLSEIGFIYNEGAGTVAEISQPSVGTGVLVSASSDATILDFEPSEGRLGLWVEETVTNIVPNDDATGYISKDAGTNWAKVQFDQSIQYSTNVGHKVWYSAVTNLSGSGSNILWKFEATNTNKVGRLHGAFPQVR